MPSHFNVKYGVSFPSKEDADRFIADNLDDVRLWFTVPCHCDNLTRAERLAMRYPRFFGWLLKREY